MATSIKSHMIEKMALLARNKVYFCFVFLCIYMVNIVKTSNSTERTLSTSWLCTPDSNSSAAVIHTSARGDRNTLHYLFSTNGGPAILVALTDNHNNVTVNCADFLSPNLTEGSVSFIQKPQYVYSVLFTKIWEYNDTDDSANLTQAVSQDNATFEEYLLNDQPFVVTERHSNPDLHVITFRLTNSSDFKFQNGYNYNGSLNMQMHVYSYADRSGDLPHLEFNSNTTKIDFTLNHAIPRYMNSRFAVEVAVLTSRAQDEIVMGINDTIDDEHTPGVFQMVNVWTQNATQSSGAYLQWKPVCYRNNSRTMAQATKSKPYPLQSLGGAAVGGLVYAYFGADEGVLQRARSFNVSFGLTQDKFYAKTNYTTWTFMVGYGTVPQDKISMLILLVISVGLGIPVLLIIFGGLCVCIKRQQQRRTQGYSSIN